MANWETFEEFLESWDKRTSFTVDDYSAWSGEPNSVASRHIQAYQLHQRSKKSASKYVLTRKVGTRTATAEWNARTRKADARDMGFGMVDDTIAKFRRAYRPDLVRLGSINPAAYSVAMAQISAIEQALVDFENYVVNAG